MNKINNVNILIKNNNLDGILFTSRYNKGYIANLFSGSGYVFITKKSRYLLVDFRYYTQMKKLNIDNFVLILTNNFNEVCSSINSIINSEGIRKIGFEGDSVTYNLYQTLKQNINSAFTSIDLSDLRTIKSPDEIAKIKKAVDIADNTYSYILNFIKIGMTEREIENELTAKIKALGGQKESFDTIVASGKRGALPHGKASNKVIDDGDFVTIDFGAVYDNYCSDITRTFVVGRNYSSKLNEIYNIVLKAQTSAIEGIKEGVTTGEVDNIARSIITSEGFGEYFKHNIGHGMGVLVHEYPNLSPNSKIILKEGMVITVEPGIYIPDIGGVRIEDDILVTKNGYEVLSHSKKNLCIID